jgi:hypothetical protein
MWKSVNLCVTFVSYGKASAIDFSCAALYKKKKKAKPWHGKPLYSFQIRCTRDVRTSVFLWVKIPSETGIFLGGGASMDKTFYSMWYLGDDIPKPCKRRSVKRSTASCFFGNVEWGSEIKLVNLTPLQAEWLTVCANIFLGALSVCGVDSGHFFRWLVVVSDGGWDEPGVFWILGYRLVLRRWNRETHLECAWNSDVSDLNVTYVARNVNTNILSVLRLFCSNVEVKMAVFSSIIFRSGFPSLLFPLFSHVSHFRCI